MLIAEPKAKYQLVTRKKEEKKKIIQFIYLFAHTLLQAQNENLIKKKKRYFCNAYVDYFDLLRMVICVLCDCDLFYLFTLF